MTTWIKVYNSMPSHPKILAVGERAAWLAICGLCYANEHLTNGFIARHVLPVVAPGVKAPEKLALRLVQVDLWHEIEGGWLIHDYGEHQRSADEIRERRAKDAERKAAHRSNGSPNGSPRGQIVDSAQIPSGVQSVDVDVEGRRQKAETEVSANADSVAAAPPLAEDRDLEERVAYLVHLASSLIRTTHGIAAKSKEARPIKAWHDACRSMLTDDGYTAEQVEYAIGWVCRHHYWSRRIRSMTRLRSEMEQVADEIRKQRDGNVVPMRGRRESPGALLRAMNGEAS